MSLSQLPLLVDRLVNAADGADARSTVSDLDDLLSSTSSSDGAVFLDLGAALLADYSFVSNAYELLATGKLLSGVNVSEGAGESLKREGKSEERGA